MYSGQPKFKGYFQYKVEELETKSPNVNFLNGFSQNLYSGYFNVTFKLEQPFSVTDGIERNKNNKILLKMYRVKDKILVPGSSLKGAIRTYFEGVCGKELAKKIFGSSESASLVYFNDVLIDPQKINVSYKPYPEQFGKEPKRKVENEIRFYTKKASEEYPQNNLPYFVECIDGQFGQFTTRIIFKAMPKKYLHLLLTVLGIENTGEPIYFKIGRGKNIGMGLVTIKLNGNVNYLKTEKFSFATLQKENITEDEEIRKAIKRLKEIQRKMNSNS